MSNEIIKREASLMPSSINDKLEMANHLAKSGLMPSQLNTKEKVFVALQYGSELGLSPMVSVQSIYVVNGRPTLSTDLMKALVFKNKMAEEFEEKELFDKDNKLMGYEVNVKRNDLSTNFNGRFTYQDAQRANLMNKDNWKKFPERMLLHRATSICLRKAFPELFAGLYTREEIIDADIIDIQEDNTENKLREVSEKLKQDEKPIVVGFTNKNKEPEKEEVKEDPKEEKPEMPAVTNYNLRESILELGRQCQKDLTKDEIAFFKQIKLDQHTDTEYSQEQYLLEMEKAKNIIESYQKAEELKKEGVSAVSDDDKDAEDISLFNEDDNKKDEELPKGVY